MKNILVIISLSLLFFNQCSYERINSPEKKRFFIQEINIEGNNKTAFIIKKKIMRFSNAEGKNKIILNINLDQGKEIQEKNIQNKVTKYKISLTAKTVIKDLLKGSEIQRTYVSSSEYNVEKRYSDTVNNLKEANKALIEIILDQILDDLRIYYN